MCRTRVVVLLVGGALCLASRAQAAEFTVNSLTDDVDMLPGDGFCATLLGECTLRAAIQEANALDGGDAILLPAGTYLLSIPGTGEDAAATGDLDVLEALEIRGSGAATTIIDAEQLDRVFDVFIQSQLHMSGLTVQDGRTDLEGGGIRQRGLMTLADCVIQQNTAVAAGGGIYSLAAGLELIRTVVSGNVADTGGGVWVSVSASFLIDSFITNNAAVDGGGVANLPSIGGTMRILNSTIELNTASRFGGGFHGARVLMAGSTINNNTAGTCGGGVSGLSQSTFVSNSTISGNRSRGDGGGICARTNDAFLSNVTVARNIADSDATGTGDGGGVFVIGAGRLHLANSLIAKNLDSGGEAPDCESVVFSVESRGYNLIENPTGCTFAGDLTGNIFWLDPRIRALADNGGPTSTHALRSNSPARDAGNPSGCADAVGTLLTTDQRGAVRPLGAACDIGSFEFGGGRQLTSTLTADGAAIWRPTHRSRARAARTGGMGH